MNICVMGVGYVGLVTGACLADIGHKVICLDTDTEKIESLTKGKISIYEPGLEQIVKKNLRENRLKFSSKSEDGIKDSKVIFISVGTPTLVDREVDLSFLKKALIDIAKFINEYKVIVNRSTTPVGTTEQMYKVMKEEIKRIQKRIVRFDVVVNPEFLSEGSALDNFKHPDRIVVGAGGKRGINIMKEIYQPLGANLYITDIKSAEMIKYASNAFLATKLSFINEIANICEKVGADVEKVAYGMGQDSRIGQAFLKAGIGFGGSCLPKDTRAIYQIARENGYHFRLIEDVIQINNDQRFSIIKKTRNALVTLENKLIGVLGLSFKPNTDDLREAPSIEIIKAFQSEGAEVKVYDPVAVKKAKSILKDVNYAKDPYEVAKDSDALVIVTEWDEFRRLDIKRIKKLLKNPIVVDGRNIFNPEAMKKLGIKYYSIGRSNVD